MALGLCSTDIMNVLLYSCEFPTPSDPSSSVFTYHIANELSQLCDIHIASAIPWFPNISYLKFNSHWSAISEVPSTAVLKGLNVDYVRYPLIPKLSTYIHPLLKALGSYRRVRSLHQQKNFDVINAHWMHPDGVAAILLGKWLNLPVVLTAMGCDINLYSQDPILVKQLRWAIKNATRVTAKSQALVKEMQALCPHDHEKISNIPNGVDASAFNFANVQKDKIREQLGLHQDETYLLYVGRLSHEKGLDVLIEALASLKYQQKLNCRVLLGGAGELKESLMQQVDHHQLQANVEFLGKLSHQQVAEYMASSDGFCLASRREGLPNVILEAMAAGLPVVASRVGGVPELIDEKSGIMVSPEDPQALAKGIDELLNSSWDEKCIADNVRQRSWQSVAQQYYDCFKCAIQEFAD